MSKGEIIIRSASMLAAIAIGAQTTYIHTEANSKSVEDSSIWEPIPIETELVIVKAPRQKSVADIVIEHKTYIIHGTTTVYEDMPFVTLPVPMNKEEQRTVFDICQEYNRSYPLVMAIIRKESEFVRTARSETGDSGYMQINDCNTATLAEIGFKDLYDTRQNISAGCYMLSNLYDKYGDNAEYILMCYNMGEKGAASMKEQGITSTKYADEILDQAEAYASYINDTLN